MLLTESNLLVYLMCLLHWLLPLYHFTRMPVCVCVFLAFNLFKLLRFCNRISFRPHYLTCAGY